MAKLVLKDAWVTINAIDLSDHIASVAVNMQNQLQEVTAMGDGGVQRAVGLRDDSFELTLRQDFAASEVDATLWPQFDGGSAFVVQVAAAGSAISATNPKYSGTVLIESYPPISGDVGQTLDTQVTLPVQGKITRATA